MYPEPQRFATLVKTDRLQIDPAIIQKCFDDFYQDIYEELSSFGQIDHLFVAGNLCEHLSGNVYVQYALLDSAIQAYSSTKGRFYAGRPIDVQFSPVERLQYAICKVALTGQCNRGENCNYVHPIFPSPEVLERCKVTYPLLSYIENQHPPHDSRREPSRTERSDYNYDHRQSEDRDRKSYERRESRYPARQYSNPKSLRNHEDQTMKRKSINYDDMSDDEDNALNRFLSIH